MDYLDESKMDAIVELAINLNERTEYDFIMKLEEISETIPYYYLYKHKRPDNVPIQTVKSFQRMLESHGYPYELGITEIKDFLNNYYNYGWILNRYVLHIFVNGWNNTKMDEGFYSDLIRMLNKYLSEQ